MNAAIGASGGTGDAGDLAAAIAALSADDTAIRALGPCRLPSPVAAHLGPTAMSFVGAADRVLIDDSVAPRYARSHVQVTAPDGPHAWLNRRRLVGTLQTLRPEHEAVLIRVWALA